MGNNNIPPLNMKSRFMVVVTTFLAVASSVNAYAVTVIWGQGGEAEGTLEQACTSGTPANYSLVKIAYLTNFGDGSTPLLNLSGHCEDPTNICNLTSDIQACHNKGIKVLLSLGWNPGEPEEFFPTPEIAKEFSSYLWNHFLAGPELSGPLGSAILDGIDIDIGTGSNDNFDVLVNDLAQRRAGRRLYLSATPNCSYPDAFLGGVINTGLMDYVFVKFYNNESCEYDVENTDPSKLFAAWEKWNGVSAGEVRLQLPAAKNASLSGYVPKAFLVDQVIPEVRMWPLYGGFMLWNRYYDIQNSYSYAIIHGGGAGIQPSLNKFKF